MSRPQIAVIVLTQMPARGGVRDLAKMDSTYECFVKQFTTGADFDRAIQRAAAFVG